MCNVCYENSDFAEEEGNSSLTENNNQMTFSSPRKHYRAGNVLDWEVVQLKEDGALLRRNISEESLRTTAELCKSEGAKYISSHLQSFSGKFTNSICVQLNSE